MKRYISRLAAAICVSVLLASASNAQGKGEPVKTALLNIESQMRLKITQPEREPFKWLDKSDAAFWAGAALDLGSSLKKREAGLFRDSRGIFSPGKNLAFKAGLFAAFKVLDWKFSTKRERRLIGWFKIGVGAAWGALAVRNFGIAKAR